MVESNGVKGNGTHEVMLDAHEAAEYLRLNVQTLRRLVREKEIPGFKVGGAWRFKKSKLDEWVEGREAARLAPTILVVDDDEMVLAYLRRVLERKGLNVVAFGDGREALAWLDEHTPQLLISDLMMPGMSGAETLRKVRARHAFLPVILITGYPDSELLSQALEHSPFALLPKPVLPGKLIEAVRWALGAENLPAGLR